MTPIGWPAVALWQLVVLLRAAFFATPYWVAWMMWWTVLGWAGRG